jgi:sulfite exporter TauE/SafE
MIFGNLVLAFVTGVISSFGHCIGMCGGIVAIYSARRPAATNSSWLMRGTALVPVHLGRVITYTLLGAAMGLAGALLEQAGAFVGWQGGLSILVGIVMLMIGLSLMGILPPVEAVVASVTGAASPMKRMRGFFGDAGVGSSIAIGLLWGLLPCGLVYAMLVNAASTQTIYGGALTMMAFGLGTIPTLLGFGLASGAIAPQLRGNLMKVAAVLVLLFGVQAILRGLGIMHFIPPLTIGPFVLWE